MQSNVFGPTIIYSDGKIVAEKYLGPAPIRRFLRAYI
jgi:hypothetical protein